MKPEFESLGAVVAGISPDRVLSHEMFRRKHNISVMLLSDPEHETMSAYGAWGKKTVKGKESFGVIRSTVLIDPEGVVRIHWPAVQPKGHAAEVLKSLRALQTGGGRAAETAGP